MKKWSVSYQQSRQDYWRYTPSGANQLAMSAGLEAAAGGSEWVAKKPREYGKWENPWKTHEKYGQPMENL